MKWDVNDKWVDDFGHSSLSCVIFGHFLCLLRLLLLFYFLRLHCLVHTFQTLTRKAEKKHLAPTLKESRKTRRLFSTDDSSGILHSITNHLCFPGQIFPRLTANLLQWNSAETPPYAAMETEHSGLLSRRGCSEQLLENGRPFFISYLVVWGTDSESHREHHAHSFPPPPHLIAALF